ncbi:MAG: hypothetical protein MUE51_06995 [Thermoleophilia bacterium]|jgi:hypothetical protein|nr:hypothetical protein [Thermoleophilia bacterium]
MIVTVVLRLHPERLAAGELAGHAEVVARGIQGLVDGPEDLIRLARQAVRPATPADPPPVKVIP